MRVNVYAEELTHELEVVKKTADNGREFYGFRFYLKSHEDLHHTPLDNDRSAVTFWVPWTKDGGLNFEFLLGMFQNATFNMKALINEREPGKVSLP